MNDVMLVIKEYILKEFLPGEDPNEFTPSTPLISSGVLDSLATIRLIQFIDDRFGVAIGPHEMTAEFMDTLEQITSLVESKA